jgi:broad specificity phosphatase PhoE
MIFIRHARPIVDETRPPAEWELAPDAVPHFALPDLPVVASAERKAQATAAFIADEFAIDHRLGEVTRPWVDDLAVANARYLLGERMDGWEPQPDAVARFTAAVGEYGEAIFVTHGTVLTLYLATAVPDLEPVGFWSGLAFPDAWSLGDNRLTRVAIPGART